MKARIAIALIFAFAAAVVAQVPDVTGRPTLLDDLQAPSFLMFPFDPFMIE